MYSIIFIYFNNFEFHEGGRTLDIKFCPRCGSRVKPWQKYCIQCGYKLISDSNIEQQTENRPITTTPPEQEQSFVPLFDFSRKYYVLKEKYWDWGSGPILDEHGNKIGSMSRKILSIRKRIDFKEVDGTISAYIEKKLIAISPTYDLRDPQGNLIGRLSKAILTFIFPKFYLLNPRGKKIMVAQGSFMRFSFTVKDMKGNLIATIDKADKWRDIFIGNLFDFSDTYIVKIENPFVDRRLLLGFVIAIDNTFHDK